MLADNRRFFISFSLALVEDGDGALDILGARDVLSEGEELGSLHCEVLVLILGDVLILGALDERVDGTDDG